MQSWEHLLRSLSTLAAGKSTSKGLCVAFSGGLDSRFLCHAALNAGVDVIALHVAGTHIPQQESAEAHSWAARVGLPFMLLRVDVLTLDAVQNNSRERCYYCKKHVFGCIRAHAGNRLLCDGTNADDMGQYRPGLRALREHNVRSPLAELGLTKAHIRATAAATGLAQPQQVARPCLLTRLAYGMTPDADTLGRIEAAEYALSTLGLTDFRLRLTPAPVLQTLPLTEYLRNAALTVLGEHGFVGTDVLEGDCVSGYFDEYQPAIRGNCNAIADGVVLGDTRSPFA